jgi:hypothetical protein
MASKGRMVGIPGVKIWQPPPVIDPGLGEGVDCGRWVAHPVDGGGEGELADWIEQKLVDLGAALFVTPVADPDQIARLDRGFARVKDGSVGRFMPDERAEREALSKIEVAENPAEGEHPIVVGKVIRAHHFGPRDEPVVGIVEEEGKAVPPAGLADAAHQLGRVPLMNEHQVGVAEGDVEIQVGRVVGAGEEVGVEIVEAAQRREAVLLNEVSQAPVVQSLVDQHLVPAVAKRAGHAAQEVGVAVIPVGEEGVVEEDDFHAGKDEVVWMVGAACRGGVREGREQAEERAWRAEKRARSRA